MLSIRVATAEDAQILADLEAKCFLPAEAASKENFQKRLNVFADAFLILEFDGKPVGFIDGMVTNQTRITDDLYAEATLHNPEGAWQSIFGIGVVPEERGQGFASLLMMEMIEKARRESRRGVILSCKEHMIDFYAQFGFETVGLSASEHGGAVWYDMTLDFLKTPATVF